MWDEKSFHSFAALKSPFMKAIIIGGGPCGLAAAIALQEKNINVAVYEAAETFKPLGAGLVLAPNAIKALDAIGVADEVTRNSKLPSRSYLKTHKGKIIVATDNHEVLAKYGVQGVTLHRAELHRILYSHLKHGSVHTNKRLRSFIQTRSSVSVTFEDGTTDAADMLIAADGIHSVVRRSLLPQSKVRYSGQTCWRGITKTELEIDEFSESWGPGARFGIVPLKDGTIYWFGVVTAKQNDASLKAITKQQLVKMFEGFHEPVQKIIEGTEEKSIIHNDLIDLEPIKQFAFGRVMLTGDAAHATTPNLGQGACMALEDAATLGKCFEISSDPVEAFKTFEAKRIARTTRIVNTSWKLGKASQISNPVLSSVRNFLLKNIPKSAAAKQSDFLFNIDFN